MGTERAVVRDGIIITFVSPKGRTGKSTTMLALMGAILLVWADVLARTLFAPQEIPIGIITSLVGAPFLLVLIRRLHVTSST